MNWSLFAGFLALTLILMLTPGPVVTLVISTGATKGVRAGLVTVAGTTSGNAVLLAAVAFGLEWVLSHALYVFEILRWAGAVYLIWLGVQAWRCGYGHARRRERFLLGGCFGAGEGMVHAARTREGIGAHLRPHLDGRRCVALASPATGLI
jgi:threonine/homoserine/homoserine lactone efflux protein